MSETITATTPAPTTEKKQAKKPAAKSQASKKAAPKKAAPLNGNKFSLLDAAVKALKEKRKPMNTKDIVEHVNKRGWWKPGEGKTPTATLYSAFLREMEKGKESRVRKSKEKGLFESTGK